MQGPLRAVDLRDGSTRYRLGTGVLAGRRYLERVNGEREIAWYDTSTGHVVARAAAPDGWSLTGASVDGSRAVLVHVAAHHLHRFGILRADGRFRGIDLGRGDWSFDALAGSRLYLLQYLRAGYEVRVYDVARGRLEPLPLKDANESAVIAGAAWERLASPDGRYLFTLYVNSDGSAMVHELDVRSATARCIDLPGSGNFNSAVSYALELSPDARTLWAVSTGYGHLIAVDVAAAHVRSIVSFAAYDSSSPLAFASAISPRGDTIALAANGRIWIADLARSTVRLRVRHVAIAIGFSPDGKTLWGVGEKSRVFSLPA